MPGKYLAASLLSIHPFSLLAGIGEVRGTEAVWAAFFGLALSLAASTALLAAAGASLGEANRQTRGGFRPLRAVDSLFERAFPYFFHLFKPPAGSPDDDPVLWRERLSLTNSRTVYGSVTVTDKLFVAGLGAATLASMFAGENRLFGLLPVGDMLPASLGLLWALVLVGVTSFLVRASQAFSKEFETGQMDLIRLTRLDGGEIVTGKLRAYARHYVPLAAMVLPWALVVAASSSVAYSSGWPSGIGPLGNPWLRSFGWMLAGFSAASIGLFSSLYFSTGTKALYGAMVFYFVPGIVMWVLALPFSGMGLAVRFIVQAFLGVFILTRVAFWAREHRGYNSKHECFVLIVVGSLAAAASGPILGPFVIYLLGYALMKRNFEQFVQEGSERYRTVSVRPALSWQHDGVFSLTHLGIPPEIETRLMTRVAAGSPADAGRAVERGRSR